MKWQSATRGIRSAVLGCIILPSGRSGGFGPRRLFVIDKVRFEEARRTRHGILVAHGFMMEIKLLRSTSVPML